MAVSIFCNNSCSYSCRALLHPAELIKNQDIYLEATTVAQNIMEEIKAKKFEEVSLAFNYPVDMSTGYTQILLF